MNPVAAAEIILDAFQIEAENLLLAGHHVLVSAPTGAGKSLIAERLIERALAAGTGVIYTGPIKALINQKYRDLYRRHGQKVGIITGDVVIRDTAPIIVATTEIFRNMAVARTDSLRPYSQLVLDEVHYLDSDRGATWEESIIFAPSHMQLLALSATVANADEIAQWIALVTQSSTRVVFEARRPVPLAVHYLDPRARPTNFRGAVTAWSRRCPNGRPPRLEHTDVVDSVARKGWLPCLYFVFSRAGCETKARDLAFTMNFLDAAEQEQVEKLLAERENPDLAGSPGFRRLSQCLGQGVAFHHAGMLPDAKELVEELYERGLVKVLYCTETFSVGVNFPVKGAIFDGVRKYSDQGFRALTTLEFQQMAGRAGRRGIDTEGHAIVALGPHDIEDLSDYSDKEPEPVISRLRLRPNTILNLVASRTDDEVRTLLTRSLKVFQAGRGKQVRKRQARTQRTIAMLMNQFEETRRNLQQLGYIEDDQLLPRGLFARSLYVEEITVTELYFSGFFHQVDERQICAIATGLAFDGKETEPTLPKRPGPALSRGLQIIRRHAGNFHAGIYRPALLWAAGAEFSKLLTEVPIAEGDLVSAFRRGMDLIRQLRRVVEEPAIRDKLERCLERLDRPPVRVELL